MLEVPEVDLIFHTMLFCDHICLILSMWTTASVQVKKMIRTTCCGPSLPPDASSRQGRAAQSCLAQLLPSGPGQHDHVLGAHIRSNSEIVWYHPFTRNMPRTCDCAIQFKNMWGCFQVNISSPDHDIRSYYGYVDVRRNKAS